MTETPDFRVGAPAPAAAPMQMRVDSQPSLSVDEMFAPPAAAELGGLTPFEALKKRLEQPAEEAKTTTLKVPARPGITLDFRGPIPAEQRKAWQNRARKKSRRGSGEPEVDEMLFSCLVLANTHKATLVDGVEAHDEDGNPLTFAHRQLWDMVDARDPEDAIRKLWANDAHVLIASGEVLLDAGFDDDLGTDPTTV